MSSNISLSHNQTIRAILEFIECAIHTILYVRQIYPADIFVRRKKYETPVFQSRHPELNEYIAGAVRAIGEEIVLGNLQKVVVVIKDKKELPLERFLFSVDQMVELASYDKDVSVDDAMSAFTLSQYFKSFMVRLCMLETRLGILRPEDEATFAIVIELKDDKTPSAISAAGDVPPWMPADVQHTTAGTTEKDELHMIRAVNTGIFSLSLAVQESSVKLEREKEEIARQKAVLEAKQGKDKGKGKQKESEAPAKDAVKEKEVDSSTKDAVKEKESDQPAKEKEQILPAKDIVPANESAEAETKTADNNNSDATTSPSPALVAEQTDTPAVDNETGITEGKGKAPATE